MMVMGPMIFIGLLLLDRVVPSPGVIWTILGPIHRLMLRLILGS
jgi:hypothetical protein